MSYMPARYYCLCDKIKRYMFHLKENIYIYIYEGVPTITSKKGTSEKMKDVIFLLISSSNI